MKSLLHIVVGLIISASTAFADPNAVELKLVSSSTISAGLTTIEFKLLEKHSSRELSESDLVVSHERILHMLIYDPSLTEFRHVHPEYKGSSWIVEVDFSTNGSYYIWAQGVTAGSFINFDSLTRLQVMNGKSEHSLPPDLTEIRQGEDNGSIATMTNEKLKVGSKAGPSLIFSRKDGSTPEISPYLGAFAHVIAVPADGSSLVHVHPQQGQSPYEGVVHFRFSKPGSYRVRVQFIDAGILRTVPMSVVAE